MCYLSCYCQLVHETEERNSCIISYEAYFAFYFYIGAYKDVQNVFVEDCVLCHSTHRIFPLTSRFVFATSLVLWMQILNP